MEISGKIKTIGQTQSFGNNGFEKRELILETNEEYSQTLLIEFHNDSTDLLDQFQSGQEVKIRINIRGREWTSPQGQSKYFNSLVGWKVERL